MWDLRHAELVTDGEYGEQSVREKTCIRERGRNEIEKDHKTGKLTSFVLKPAISQLLKCRLSWTVNFTGRLRNA